MAGRYVKAGDGDWIWPVRRGWRHRCCDCDLIHTVNFRVRNGRIELQPTRDDRATATARRRRASKRRKAAA